MNIRIEKAGPCRREVHIEVPADHVRIAFDEVASSYSRHAKIPGFRPGRAPRDLIRRRFQKEIADDVKERLISEGYQAALKQEKFTTVAVLDVREQGLDEGQAFSFSLVLDIAPEIELPAYKGIALTRNVAEVTEKDVENVVESLREQQGHFDDATTRPVQLGDMVQIDYSGVIEGQPIEERAPDAKGMGAGKDFWLMADEQNQFLPGFANGLLGAAVGERREIAVDFPADFSSSALAGKKATYVAQVKSIREKKLPEINEEFLKNVGVSSVDELHTRIREDMKKFRIREEDRRLRGEVVKHLIEKATFDAPESVLQEETRQEVYDLVRRTQQSGITADEIEGKKEELFDNATRNATEKVKLRYMLNRIAKEENITASDRDVDDRIRSLAAQWGVPAEKLRADFVKRKAMEDVRSDVLMDKTLTLLMEHSVITDEGVAVS